MASELRVTTIANNAGTESVGSTYVINGSAKGWVNYNEPNSGSPSVQQSFNNSSLTDNATGDQTVTYTNAFDYADYAYSFTHHRSGTSDNNRRSYGHDISTTTARVRHIYQYTSLSDTYDGMIISHGDLA